MIKKYSLSLICTLFLTLICWSQNCLPDELEVERFDRNGKSAELSKYQFTYDDKGKIQKVRIEADESEQILKFEQVDLGKKITWLWDGEYDSHYVITSSDFFVFEDENDLNPENAEKYKVVYENGAIKQVHYSDTNNETFTKENGVVIKSVVKEVKLTRHTNYTYKDVSNPFFNLQELGFIQLYADNFIPLFLTLSEKVLASEKSTILKDGIETIQEHNNTYDHTTNTNGCPSEFTIQEKFDKVVYRISYK